MKQPRFVAFGPILWLLVACGGTEFTAGPSGDGGGAGDDGHGGGSTSGSSGGASSGGSSSGAGGSSSGGSSTGGSSSGSSSGGGSSSGSSGSSGSSSGSSGSSSSGASSSSSGGADAGASPCPLTLPAAGGGCPRSGLVCEYGGAVVQACDSVATCGTSGWTIQAASLTDCGGKNSTSCPTTYLGVPKGSVCSPDGLLCDYLEGRCQCAAGGGVVHLVDGSIVANWFCQAPATGCPQRRPMLGSVCSTPGVTCDYGACYVEGGTSELCTGGLWTETGTACPALASP